VVAEKGGETVPENVTDSPGCAGLGEIISVNVPENGIAYAGESEVTPIIVSTRIERTATPMNLNL
jgi:hypothetical protein